MKQYDAVIEVMKANGGYSTLGHLYAEALRVPGVQWKTKTPFASIRRIVQDERFFFKIRPGLWALNEPEKIFLSKKSSRHVNQPKQIQSSVIRTTKDC